MSLNTNKFNCVLCSSNTPPSLVHDHVKGDIHSNLKVVRCSTCGHTQLNPPNYSIDHYKEDGQVNFVVHDYGTPIEKLVDHSWIEANRRVKRFLEKGIILKNSDLNKPLRILDIGGGYGFFASELKRQYPDLEVEVMEPSAKRVELGKEYLMKKGENHPTPKFVVELLDDNFIGQHRGTYDIVTMWHVLEHVSNPVAFLKLASELVKPKGGIVCVEVPNLDDELMRLSTGFRDRNFMIEHISYFSKDSLKTVALNATSNSLINIYGYQRYGIFNYFNWIHFNKPQGANPDLFEGTDRWWLEASWRATREHAMTSDALFMTIQM